MESLYDAIGWQLHAQKMRQIWSDLRVAAGKLSDEGARQLMLDVKRCPACLSWQTARLAGNEFIQCASCHTIAAVNRHTTAIYDSTYVAARYERYSTTHQMSQIRVAVLEQVLKLYESLQQGTVSVDRGLLLDVGYGNGDFIRFARKVGWNAWGYDVNPTRYEGVRQTRLPNEPNWPIRYRVITFFDALEHFEDLTHARWVSHAADWLVLSFPAVPPSFPFEKNWKHYRPGEHHLYFHPEGLANIFSHNGRKAELVYRSNPEDCIRQPTGEGPNIWTVALRCSSEKENTS